MSYREALVVARLRQDLRERLMNENLAGVWDVLARFERLAELYADVWPELAAEAARWRIRFHLLASDLMGSPAA